MEGKPAHREHIATLDGLRAVAIGLVLLSHGIDRQHFTGLAEIGHVGVMIFFALSGFLITTRLRQEYEARGRFGLTNFYIRRAFRILPPALAYLGILAILSGLGWVICSRSSIWSAVFLYTNYIQVGPLGWRAGHFWSLSVEEHFYLVWPALLLGFGAKKGWRTAGILIAIICVWRVADWRYHILDGALNAPHLWTSDHRTDLIADTLLWGCCLSFVPLDRLGTSIGRWATPIALGAATLMVAYAMPDEFGRPLSFLPRSGERMEPVMHLLPTILLAAVVCVPKSPIGRFLDLAPLRFIGNLSYSLYIWQQLFLGGPGPHLPTWLAFAATFATAYLSYRYIERPLIRIGSALVKTRLARPHTAANAAIPE